MKIDGAARRPAGERLKDRPPPAWVFIMADLAQFGTFALTRLGSILGGPVFGTGLSAVFAMAQDRGILPGSRAALDLAFRSFVDPARVGEYDATLAAAREEYDRANAAAYLLEAVHAKAPAGGVTALPVKQTTVTWGGQPAAPLGEYWLEQDPYGRWQKRFYYTGTAPSVKGTTWTAAGAGPLPYIRLSELEAAIPTMSIPDIVVWENRLGIPQRTTRGFYPFTLNANALTFVHPELTAFLGALMQEAARMSGHEPIDPAALDLPAPQYPLSTLVELVNRYNVWADSLADAAAGVANAQQAETMITGLVPDVSILPVVSIGPPPPATADAVAEAAAPRVDPSAIPSTAAPVALTPPAPAPAPALAVPAALRPADGVPGAAIVAAVVVLAVLILLPGAP